MAKTQTVFVCSECGYEVPRWMGKCPSCSQWNTFLEEKQVKEEKGRTRGFAPKPEPVRLDSIKADLRARESTGFKEFDRVLGGGLVKGSLILIGGDPGIGKSTLVLQVCEKADIKGRILYVSGEESAAQIKLRADRLKIANENILFIGETDIGEIENAVEMVRPGMLVIDSIQTMYSQDMSSAPGSVSQVREVTARLMNLAKSMNITTLVIGHVTKEGAIAGPRVLEHIVDAVLYLEGERFFAYRILRGVKNRFGSTNEIGIFEMKEEGMTEVSDPSGILISDRYGNPSGSVIVASMEGTRPMLVEIQALVSVTPFGMPRRMATGIDYNRLVLLLAVLEKRAGLVFHNQDVYLNVVGGLKLDEPAVDLGVVVAAASSLRNVSAKPKTVVMGEVGLTGEIRSVNAVDRRINEAVKMGFECCVVPQENLRMLKPYKNINIVGVREIGQVMDLVVG